ncbi:MAG: NADPH-dependent FMN reductase [Planctomycetota bacterium]|jgi:NAD(P)H-dependent FMN reductase
MTAPRILAFAGSLRTGSFNKSLVHVAATAARDAGAETTVIDLRDFAMPIFDEDLEQREGLPDSGRQLKEMFRAHDGLLIASPEYNSSYSAALKNTIDWVSRPEPDQPPLSCFVGKVAGIMAASPGALGGLRGLVHLRALLGNIRVLVIPDQHALPKAAEAFSGGTLTNERDRVRIEGIGRAVADSIRRLNRAD